MSHQRDQRRRPAAKPLQAKSAPAGGGVPLPPATQTHMGAAFGHDFSQVRVFADEDAAETADGMGARAYTLGSDIFFNDGHFNPHSGDGQTLLAHELTHIVQHERHGGALGGLSAVSSPGDASEREASALAGPAAAGRPVQVQAAPTATASRGLLDWAEGEVSGAAHAVSHVASEAGHVASEAGHAVGHAAGEAWQGAKGVASDVGHTVGHAIEAVTGYSVLLHGEAVGWGMLVALRIALERGSMTREQSDRAAALIRAVGALPPFHATAQALLLAAGRDKKNSAGTRRFVLPCGIEPVVREAQHA